MTEKQYDLVRVNTRIAPEINGWLDAKSKRTGIPKSALIHMILESHIQQVAVVDELPKIYEEIKKLKSNAAAETVR